MTATDAIPTGDTVEEIVDEVIASLVGIEAGNVTTLKTGITAVDTSIPLSDANGVSRCVIEIDHELMLVLSVDTASGVATVGTKTRGYRGTQAVAHDAGSLVTVAPPIPRSLALRALNNAIVNLYPDITAPVTEEVEVYEGWAPVSSEGEVILDVMVQDGTDWIQAHTWRAKSDLPTSISSSGRAIRIPGLNNGDDVRVTVGRRPSPFVSTGASFSSTGLSPSLRSVVILDAAVGLLPAFDAYRLALAKVGDGGQVAVGPASLLARELTTKRNLQLARAQAAYRAQWPTRAHFS